jgi:hypothetical protein
MNLQTWKESSKMSSRSMFYSSSNIIRVEEHVAVSTKGRVLNVVAKDIININIVGPEYITTQYAKITYSMQSVTVHSLPPTIYSSISYNIAIDEEEKRRIALKKKVEEWRRFMLENPPPKPEFIAPIEEWDYYDEEYVKRKLGALS